MYTICAICIQHIQYIQFILTTLIYFKHLPTSCKGVRIIVCVRVFLVGIPIYFKRLPTSWSHLLYPSDLYNSWSSLQGFVSTKKCTPGQHRCVLIYTPICNSLPLGAGLLASPKFFPKQYRFILIYISCMHFEI